VKTGIQKLLKLLDSPVSSTGQAQSRTSLEYNPAHAGRNDKKVIATQSQLRIISINYLPLTNYD
jgi:hypothetical protein